MRNKMGDMDPAGLSVLYADCGDHIEPEKRQVGKVVLVQGLVMQVSVDKPQASQRLPAYGIFFEGREENTLRISDYHVGDRPLSRYQETYLSIKFRGDLREILSKLCSYQFAVHPPAINPLERIYLTALESCKFSVKYRYLSLR